MTCNDSKKNLLLFLRHYIRVSCIEHAFLSTVCSLLLEAMNYAICIMYKWINRLDQMLQSFVISSLHESLCKTMISAQRMNPSIPSVKSPFSALCSADVVDGQPFYYDSVL